MEIKDLLAKYISGHKILTTQLDQIPAKVIHFKPQKNKWSIAEIIVHLADSEAHGFVRAKKIIAECGGKVCVYNQQIWAEQLFYDQMDYKDALELIRIVRKSLYKVLTLISEETWHNYIYHPETGKITLTGLDSIIYRSYRYTCAADASELLRLAETKREGVCLISFISTSFFFIFPYG